MLDAGNELSNTVRRKRFDQAIEPCWRTCRDSGLWARGRLARCLLCHGNSAAASAREKPARRCRAHCRYGSHFLIAMCRGRPGLAPGHQLKTSLWHLAVGGAVTRLTSPHRGSPAAQRCCFCLRVNKGAFMAKEAAKLRGTLLRSRHLRTLRRVTQDCRAERHLIAGSLADVGRLHRQALRD